MSTPVQVPGYRIEGPIGFGSDGPLWLGRDEESAARAIRVLGPPPAGRERARVRRLRVLIGIRHPNLAPVLDVVPLAGGGHAVVSEAIPGPTLATVRAGRSGLTSAEAAGVIQDLCAGLSTLHAEGLIHGDIAPGNVLISPRADGGSVAVLVDLTGEVGFEGGTNGFTGPEVGTTDAPGLPSDIFALASLAVWMVRESDSEDIERRLQAALATEPADRPDIGELTAQFSSDWTRPVVLPGAGSLAGASLREHAQRDLTRRKGSSRPRHRRPRRVVTRPRLVGVGALGVALTLGLMLEPFGSRGASGPGSQTGTATESAAEEQTDREIDPVEVIEAVRELTAARDAALNAGDPDELASLSVSDSPAHQRDITLLTALQESQVQVRDLRTDVLDVDVTDVGGGTARATVRLHQQPYHQIHVDGGEVIVPERRTCAVLTLAHSGEGWQVTTTQVC